MLGHKVSKDGIEVDRAKVSVISNLPIPNFVKVVRSFLGHAGFYWRFIKDFSKIGKPLFNLLCKDVEFQMDEQCIKAFNELKKLLSSASIVQPPDWSILFEVMCDASDIAVGVVLGQRKDGKQHVIY